LAFFVGGSMIGTSNANRSSPMRKAKKAILQSPEVQAILDSIWDGQLVIVIDKVKGKLTCISIQPREDDLVTDILALP
jgi:hypothetical protein